MAQKTTVKKRQVKPAETVRKKISSDTKKPVRQQVLRNAAKKAGKPFGFLRFLRYIVPPYFRNSWEELKQVSWPGRKQTWQLTLAVFIFAIGFAAFITIIDFGLDKIFKRILLK